jgi:hypothetical protein
MAVPQLTVAFAMAFGIPGEAYLDGPTMAAPWMLESNGEPNIIGATAYTVTAEGTATAGGTGIFCGILANPKTYVMQGQAAGPLAPDMVLPDGSEGELVTMHPGLIVTLPNVAAIGDKVIFNNTTGAISSLAPATAVPGGSTLIAGANVVRFTVAAAGLAVIRLSGQV